MQDYKKAHIDWAKKHDYSPPGHYDTYMTPSPYWQVLEHIYYSFKPELTYNQQFAMLLFNEDKRIRNASINLASPPKTIDVWITIGFIKENRNFDKMVKFVRNILSSKWVKSGSKAVLEFHGSKGWRPHTHMLLKCDPSVKYTSNVKDKLAKKLLGKEFIGLMEGTNNIEYSNAYDYHNDYLSGNKQDSKIEFVNQDRDFRDLNQIPHIFVSS